VKHRPTDDTPVLDGLDVFVVIEVKYG